VHGRVEGWLNLRPRLPAVETRAHVEDPAAADLLGRFLVEELERAAALGRLRPPVVLCIGSDRSTGDSLGPLVGTLLRDGGVPDRFVLGDLTRPIHASNLRHAVATLAERDPKRAVVAVDACLGRQESVGVVTAGTGPLRPGAGVNKDLPPVGDLYLTGTVNVSGFMEYFVLQNTRLSLVMAMARLVATVVRGVLPHGGLGT
jgi:putative sporulation protein YyaC